MTTHEDLQRLAEGVVKDGTTFAAVGEIAAARVAFWKQAPAVLSLLQEIERLRKDAEWVACSERMPELGGIYQFYQPQYDRVYCDGYAGEHNIRGVTHWKKLSQPPTPGSPS